MQHIAIFSCCAQLSKAFSPASEEGWSTITGQTALKCQGGVSSAQDFWE